MDKVLRKSYRILGLSFVILLSALFFFFWRGKALYEKISSPVKESSFRVQPLSPGFRIGEERFSPSLKNLPAPDKFPYFVYPEKKSLEIKTKCADAYYTILIFSANYDYRLDPTLAKFNRAFPCQPGQKIEEKIDLTALNLAPGKNYYFVADQGKTGTWYNPR